MDNFYSHLSEVLSYCGKDYEDKARKLCESYPDFSLLSQVDGEVISEICGEKYSTMIRILAAIAGRRISDDFKFGRPHTEEEILDFLSGYYFDIVNETVLVLPLDKKGCVLAAEEVVEGTVNFSGVITRKLLEIMIKYKSKSAILVHNHPGGKAKLSAEDIETTRIVSELLRSSDMRLVCHYVVAGKDVARLDPETCETNK